jgi:hypothetical protein
MKIVAAGLATLSCALIVLAGCATMAPPQPPSLALPKPPADLRAARKGNKVVLTWTIPGLTTDRQTERTIGVTRICRSTVAQLTQCGTPVGESPAEHPAPTGKKQTTTYTDTLPSEVLSSDPAAVVTYAIEVLNMAGRSAGLSNQVKVPTLRTQPPPGNFTARVISQGVSLNWTGDVFPAGESSEHYVYRVYRRQEGSQQWVLAGELPAAADPIYTLTDSTIEWEKTYEYRVETVTVQARSGKPELQIEGDDSPTRTIFADDIFPPAVPSGVQAVYSGAGGQSFVDLIWAPVPDLDLAGYNVYRREEGTSAVKINGELVKTPAYRDPKVAAGKNYLYSISAVDARGNESSRSEEAAEQVP